VEKDSGLSVSACHAVVKSGPLIVEVIRILSGGQAPQFTSEWCQVAREAMATEQEYKNNKVYEHRPFLASVHWTLRQMTSLRFVLTTPKILHRACSRNLSFPGPPVTAGGWRVVVRYDVPRPSIKQPENNSRRPAATYARYVSSCSVGSC